MAAVDFDFYLITDRHRTRGQPLIQVVTACLKAGIRAVQVREKDLGTRELIDLLLTLKPICNDFRARLLVNDRVDLALALDLDGVHLPQAGLPPEKARNLLGPEKLIGVSTHSLAEAQAAQTQGADFVTFGPVFTTLSKAAYGEPAGLHKLAEAVSALHIPVFALGGIGAERLPELSGTGVYGLAMISALMEAQDPESSASVMIQKWREMRK